MYLPFCCYLLYIIVVPTQAYGDQPICTFKRIDANICKVVLVKINHTHATIMTRIFFKVLYNDIV